MTRYTTCYVMLADYITLVYGFVSKLTALIVCVLGIYNQALYNFNILISKK